MRSPGLAPDRRIDSPCLAYPITVTLIVTDFDRPKSPPINSIRNRREARIRPPRHCLNHGPVLAAGIARLKRKNAGSAPIAAISLTALASDLYPTESGWCRTDRKWTPSTKKSLLTTSSRFFFGTINAASSPMPSRRPVPPALAPVDRTADMMRASSSLSLVIGTVVTNLTARHTRANPDKNHLEL